MIVVDCVQGTGEWWEAKRGFPSASNFDRILTPKTCKPSGSQDDYIAELIGDLACLTPNYFTTQGRPITPAMTHGTDCEPRARQWYAMERGLQVQTVGFIMDDARRFGCSPDGLVGDDGGLELKCPQLKTQAAYLLSGELPSEYKCQVHGSLIVTGRKWWDFCSYSPGLRPVLIRVVPDDFTEKLRAALGAFWVKYQAAIEIVRGQDTELLPPGIVAAAPRTGLLPRMPSSNVA